MFCTFKTLEIANGKVVKLNEGRPSSKKSCILKVRIGKKKNLKQVLVA